MENREYQVMKKAAGIALLLLSLGLSPHAYNWLQTLFNSTNVKSSRIINASYSQDLIIGFLAFSLCLFALHYAYQLLQHGKQDQEEI